MVRCITVTARRGSGRACFSARETPPRSPISGQKAAVFSKMRRRASGCFDDDRLLKAIADNPILFPARKWP